MKISILAKTCIVLTCSVLFGPISCATESLSETKVSGATSVGTIDWTKLKTAPLRKQKQVLDVSAVSDPELAARIIEAAEPILRFLGLLMAVTTDDASEPYIRSRVKSPKTVIRIPPRSDVGSKSRFLHTRLYDWKQTGPDEIEFMVHYLEINGKRHYTDDFRFIRFNGAWYFAGHVSVLPSPIQTTPVKVPFG